MLTAWQAGHPHLAQTLERVPYAALASRIQVRIRLVPVLERERFAALITHTLKSAGCQHTLLSDSGLELLRQASKEFPRQAGNILHTALRLAVPKGAQPSARRSAVGRHRGFAKKAREPVDEADTLLEEWTRLFLQDLSDEAAAALSQFVTVLASLVKSLWAANKPSSASPPSSAERALLTVTTLHGIVTSSRASPGAQSSRKIVG